MIIHLQLSRTTKICCVSARTLPTFRNFVCYVFLWGWNLPWISRSVNCLCVYVVTRTYSVVHNITHMVQQKKSLWKNSSHTFNLCAILGNIRILQFTATTVVKNITLLYVVNDTVSSSHTIDRYADQFMIYFINCGAMK